MIVPISFSATAGFLLSGQVGDWHALWGAARAFPGPSATGTAGHSQERVSCSRANVPLGCAQVFNLHIHLLVPFFDKHDGDSISYRVFTATLNVGANQPGVLDQLDPGLASGTRQNSQQVLTDHFGASSPSSAWREAGFSITQCTHNLKAALDGVEERYSGLHKTPVGVALAGGPTTGCDIYYVLWEPRNGARGYPESGCRGGAPGGRARSWGVQLTGPSSSNQRSCRVVDKRCTRASGGGLGEQEEVAQ